MYLVQGVVIGGNKVVIKIPLITTRYTLIISELSVSVIFVALIWRKIIFLLMNSPDTPSLLNAWDDWTNQNFWSVHPYLSVACCSLCTHIRSWFQLKVPWWIVKQKFCKLAPHALKGQKLIAQGIALGIIAFSNTPCKGKSFVNTWYFEAFALTGRQFCVRNYPGLWASEPSARFRLVPSISGFPPAEAR